MFYTGKGLARARANGSANKGFTLVEVVVVIIILGIIAAIAVPSFIGYIERGRITTAATDATQLASNINTLNLSLGGTLTQANLDNDPEGLMYDLIQKNLFPQLSGDYDEVITYIKFNDETRLFQALTDNEIRNLINGGG